MNQVKGTDKPEWVPASTAEHCVILGLAVTATALWIGAAIMAIKMAVNVLTGV
jgi:hypothetical protein